MSEPPRCCICLDPPSGPAALPCGHCFCLGCIGEYWRVCGSFVCPLCQVRFSSRPQLETQQTGRSPSSSSSSEPPLPLRAGEVPCDVCLARRPAVRSCLQCMASYCAAHLRPHYTDEDLGHHVLLGVAKNLEESACRLHSRRLSRFCCSDQTCICSVCERAEHRGHRVISISREAARKKGRLRRRRTKLQKDIQERQGEIEEMKPRREAPAEERARAESRLRQLEEEIAELQRRAAELEQLSHTDDSLQFLQSFVQAAPLTADTGWTARPKTIVPTPRCDYNNRHSSETPSSMSSLSC